jgi:hypothetical protein
LGAALHEVDAAAGAMVNTRLAQAAADRFCNAQVTVCHAIDTGESASFGPSIAPPSQPTGQGIALPYPDHRCQFPARRFGFALPLLVSEPLCQGPWVSLTVASSPVAPTRPGKLGRAEAGLAHGRLSTASSALCMGTGTGQAMVADS